MSKFSHVIRCSIQMLGHYAPIFSYNQDSCHFYFLHHWKNIQPKQCDLVKWAHGNYLIRQPLRFLRSSSPRGIQPWSWLFTSCSPHSQQFCGCWRSVTGTCHSRATTYYLADRRYDMLPSILSADLCSLLGGVDRWVWLSPSELFLPRPSSVFSLALHTCPLLLPSFWAACLPLPFHIWLPGALFFQPPLFFLLSWCQLSETGHRLRRMRRTL